MTHKEIVQQVVDIHNLLIDIFVKGEDAIIMGMVLQNIRNLIIQLQEEESQ